MPGWVGVPLRLNGAVVRDPVYDGPGEHVLRFDPDRDGYVVWIRGAAGKSHEVSLKVLAPVVQVGPESHLRLNIPRAAVSQLHLQVPVERAAGPSFRRQHAGIHARDRGWTHGIERSGPGRRIRVGLARRRNPSGRTAIGARSHRLAVRSHQRSLASTPRPSSWSAAWAASSIAFKFDLPPGADYVGIPPAGMTFVAVDATAAKGKIYEVKLERKTAGPVEVPLVTERIHNSPQADESLELAGLRGRRRGPPIRNDRGQGRRKLASAVGRNQPCHPGRGPGRSPASRRSDRRIRVFRPALLAGRSRRSAANSRPSARRIRAASRQRGSSTWGEAQIHDSRRQSALLGDLTLPGWEVDLVGPANLVNVDAAIPAQNGSLLIPLLQASSGELELTIEAHRKISHDNEDLVVLELPQPQAETVAPANVAVVPADNIELAFDAERAVALAPQTVRPQMKLPERLQDPLFFRTEGPAGQVRRFG